VPPYEDPGRIPGVGDSWSGPGMATPPIDLSHGVKQASTSIDFQTESSLLSLPPAFRPKRLGFTCIPSHGIDLLLPPVPRPTFEHFLSFQPDLPTLVHDISFGEIFLLFSYPFNFAIAACDGSV
jgi:hypothetical protein